MMNIMEEIAGTEANQAHCDQIPFALLDFSQEKFKQNINCFQAKKDHLLLCHHLALLSPVHRPQLLVSPLEVILLHCAVKIAVLMNQLKLAVENAPKFQ